ncbi:Spastin, partial [Diplonema papillatum]
IPVIDVQWVLRCKKERKAIDYEADGYDLSGSTQDNESEASSSDVSMAFTDGSPAGKAAAAAAAATTASKGRGAAGSGIPYTSQRRLNNSRAKGRSFVIDDSDGSSSGSSDDSEGSDSVKDRAAIEALCCKAFNGASRLRSLSCKVADAPWWESSERERVDTRPAWNAPSGRLSTGAPQLTSARPDSEPAARPTATTARHPRASTPGRTAAGKPAAHPASVVKAPRRSLSQPPKDAGGKPDKDGAPAVSLATQAALAQAHAKKPGHHPLSAGKDPLAQTLPALSERSRSVTRGGVKRSQSKPVVPTCARPSKERRLTTANDEKADNLKPGAAPPASAAASRHPQPRVGASSSSSNDAAASKHPQPRVGASSSSSNDAAAIQARPAVEPPQVTLPDTSPPTAPQASILLSPPSAVTASTRPRRPFTMVTTPAAAKPAAAAAAGGGGGNNAHVPVTVLVPKEKAAAPPDSPPRCVGNTPILGPPQGPPPVAAPKHKARAPLRSQHGSSNNLLDKANAGKKGRNDYERPWNTGSRKAKEEKDKEKEENVDHIMKILKEHELTKYLPLDMLTGIRNEILDVNTLKEQGVTFCDVHGLEEAKKTLERSVILPQLNPKLFQGLRKPAKGLLLFGPPGNGKTMLAKAVAAQCNLTFFNISASAMTSKMVGDGEKNVKALFACARALAPSFVFLDEIDSLLTTRSGGGSEHEASRRLKTEFLVQLDGAGASNDKVLVMAATNRPMDLDDAVLRRMEKRVFVPLPNKATRRVFCERTLRRDENLHLEFDEEAWELLASETEDYSFCDLSNLCRELALAPLDDCEDLLLADIADLRPINQRDVRRQLTKIRKSVSDDLLRQLVEWNKKFGAQADE